MIFISISKSQNPTLRLRQRLFCLLGAAVLSLLITSPAQSQIFYVSTSDDGIDDNPGNGNCGPCTLRAAIQEANALNGADIIEITAGFNPQLTIIGNSENSAAQGDLDITSDLTIRGADTTPAIISGTGFGDRIFHVLGNNKKVTLKNITIKGARINNTKGAGILIQGDNTTVTIENSSITNNEIYITTSATVIPSFGESGGGIYVDGDSELILKNSDISNNTAPFGAGISNLGRLVSTNSTISNNIATYTFNLKNYNGYGGGIMNLGGYLNVGGNSITNNTAGQGAGIYHTTAGLNIGDSTITNSTISGNQALFKYEDASETAGSGGFGGGILNVGPMTISNSTINSNHADGDGGGLASSGGLSNVDITNSTISSNTARSGGGIFTNRDATLTNVTIFNNEATPHDPADISKDCTADTQCTIGGDEIAIYDTDTTSSLGNPSITLVNTIIANELGRTEDVCAGLAGYETFIHSAGNNLENNDTSTCGLSASKNDIINSVATGLLALTTESNTDTAVHPLSASSLAKDNGNDSACPTVDQRFMLRAAKSNGDSLGACDIGAYEFGADRSVKTEYMDLKLTLDDNRDPVAANDPLELLTYSVIITNLSADVAAENINIAINLPQTTNFVRITKSSTDDATPTCLSEPDSNKIMACNVSYLSALGRAEIFVTVMPTVEALITASAEISNSAFLNPADSFLGNNSDTENTEVTSIGTGSSSTNNFNGLPPGGGGVIQPLLLIIAGLLLARRRQQQGS